MSDAPGGTDWWLATDGKWYPPAAPIPEPTGAPVVDLPPPASVAPGPARATPAAPAHPLRSRYRAWGIVGVLLLIVVGVAIAVGASEGDDSVSASEAVNDLMGLDDDFAPALASAPLRLQYCWSGTASVVSITMATAGGDTSKAANQKNNQCLEFGRAAPGRFAYIDVQNESSSGTVACSVKVDGVEVEMTTRVDGVQVEPTTSVSGYVIASCSGRI